MSDSFTIIVPERVMIPEEEARALGKRMLSWLREKAWVGSPLPGCILTRELGYRLTKKTAEIILPEDLPLFTWVADHCDQQVYGYLAIDVADELKVVHHSGQGGIVSATCPVCGQEIGEQYYDLIETWWNAEGNDDVICPQCQQSSPLPAFKSEPVWGFSNLSFQFWNINARFSDHFLAVFAKELGEPVRVVTGKV
ncbi:hypothetical protein [Trabulsiella odontotermitis]|uniref:hypothetical protein n=1 Tax=Trabulsiella odontotermitis TaxID=379893 RepID=UPI00067605BC|nr:hypothetical protein [Trabulsiella odontotermitis]